MGCVSLMKSESREVDLKIGNNIRTIRNMLGMTQNQLAKLLNVSPQQVNKYEKGSDKVSIAMILKIRDIFSCDLQLLLPEKKEDEKKKNNLLKVAEEGVKLKVSGGIKKDKNKNAIELLKLFFKMTLDEQEELIKELKQKAEKESNK